MSLSTLLHSPHYNKNQQNTNPRMIKRASLTWPLCPPLHSLPSAYFSAFLVTEKHAISPSKHFLLLCPLPVMLVSPFFAWLAIIYFRKFLMSSVRILPWFFIWAQVPASQQCAYLFFFSIFSCLFNIPYNGILS